MGAEPWPLTLREEHRLRACENRVLRRIFGTKRGEIIGDWAKLHNEELRNLLCSPNTTTMIKTKRILLAAYVARMRERRKHTGF
jgi:hypothetical protein